MSSSELGASSAPAVCPTQALKLDSPSAALEPSAWFSSSPASKSTPFADAVPEADDSLSSVDEQPAPAASQAPNPMSRARAYGRAEPGSRTRARSVRDDDVVIDVRV